MKFRAVQWLGRNVFPENGIVADAHPGLRLRLHPRDWIEYLLLRGDRYEPRTLAFLESNLRPGETAILAGVNFGQHVAVAARAVGPSGRVIGVEPQPRALARARDNLRLNGLELRVTLVAAALGNHEGLAPMPWSDPTNTGAASLLDSGAEQLLVPVLRLPQVLEAASVRRIRLLLLDVQGYETRVLAGLDGGPLPDILVVEVEELFLGRAGITPEELLRQMAALGYELYTLDGTPLTAPPTDLSEPNVVGLRPGVSATWSA